MIGTFAKNAAKFQMIFQKMTQMGHKWFEEPWKPEVDTANMRVNLSLTPGYDYTRADCPRYGEMKGPSCFTAPQLVVRPDLPEKLLPQNYQVPADLQPPRGTKVGPNGNLIAVGPPLVVPPEGPNLVDPNPPLPPWQQQPTPRIPGTADPDLLEPPPTPGPPIPAAPVAPGARDGGGAPIAPASFGGNVGPVGSGTERAQLSVMTGVPASTATQLLLGPVARGTTVSLAKTSKKGAQ